jgi:hypothetical protein
MQEQITTVMEKNMPNIVCLLNLLAEHPAITESTTLTGTVEMIKTQVSETWEKLESAAA